MAAAVLFRRHGVAVAAAVLFRRWGVLLCLEDIG